MAISSALNPASIARERGTTAAAAQNFITGGTPLGEGVVASAANKIVGFQRGAAGVAARPPDLNGIIQTLSTSILNNVENRVQSINQNVTQIVNKTIGGLEQDYKERLDKIDTAKPNSILQNFLNLYKSALEYIQFLGNRKNVRTLGDNLKALQNVFTETFNVAKIIRQTIVKIVKQLSNLPAATAGGGGLNLDIDIPGGSLRKGRMGGIARMMRRRPGMMLGGAALAGGLGSQVVSGMMDLGGDVQAAPMTEGTIPTSLLDRFNGILDRFSAAINSLSTVKRSQPSSGGGGGGTTPPPAKDKSGGGGGGAAGTASDVTADTKEEKAWLQTLRKTEGTAGQDGYGKVFGGQVVKELSEGKLTVEEAAKMSETGKLPDRLGGKQIAYGKYGGRVSGATGAYQFMPGTLRAAARRAGVDLNTPMTPEVQDKLALAHLQAIGIDPTKAATETTIRKAGGSAGWAGVHGEATGQTKRTVKESLAIYNQFYGSATATTKPQTTPQKPSTVAAAQTQATNAQQVAQSVSRPPTQQPAQVTVAPMNMASPQTQSTKVGDKAIPPPVMSKGGVTLPFLSSSNNDNFLTLYSKIVYNIVDG